MKVDNHIFKQMTGFLELVPMKERYFAVIVWLQSDNGPLVFIRKVTPKQMAQIGVLADKQNAMQCKIF